MMHFKHIWVVLLEEWGAHVTPEEFDEVLEHVLAEYFSTTAIYKARDLEPVQCDHIHKTVLLFNHDVLVYHEFCHAIRMGDIGHVLNVLHLWMVMMHGQNHMPKYANVIFNTFSHLTSYPDEMQYVCF